MSLRAERPEPLSLAGGAGRIQCLLERVEEGARPAGAVICHPHPLFGGSMTNKVVHTMSRAFHRLGISTLRFNFRGVGASDGQHDEGRGETDDLLRVADWACSELGCRALWLAGFSFGAWIALRAAARRECAQLVTVAPPVHRFAIADEPVPDCPWLIVQGGEDELVDCDAVVEWVNEMKPGPELVVLPGADHFFHGVLVELRETLIANLGVPDGPIA